MEILKNCPDCGVKPGEIHQSGCDVERCSVCGFQVISNFCNGHDPTFSRWTGFWPGKLESKALGIDLNKFYVLGYHEIFFIKPSK